jgi:hypothetical protein
MDCDYTIVHLHPRLAYDTAWRDTSRKVALYLNQEHLRSCADVVDTETVFT